MSLQGAPQLRARLQAIKVSFKPIGRAWAEETIRQVQPIAPRRTGKGARSFKVKNASMKLASVAAIFYMRILDQGTKAYDIKPKGERLRFEIGKQAVFAKKVHRPATRGLGFALRAAKQSLQRHPMAEQLIREWNAAS